jgi:hypothetical protein
MRPQMERKMSHTSLTDISTWPVEWLRIVDLEEAGTLSSLSADTIEREHKDKIVRLSKRRRGMRVGHALMLSATRGDPIPA